MGMFCYQCEQTAKSTGCTAQGVCGKDPEVAGLQDLLVEAVKGIARYAHCARQQGAKDGAIDGFVIEALFATLTNVNFDAARFNAYLGQAAAVHDKAKALCAAACQKAGKACADLGSPARTPEDASIQKRIAALGDTVTGLQELIVYGLKGVAALVPRAAHEQVGLRVEHHLHSPAIPVAHHVENGVEQVWVVHRHHHGFL